jgi:hypothetical protein
MGRRLRALVQRGPLPQRDKRRLVGGIEKEIGPIEVLVFNIGADVPSSILEETARNYFKI